MPEPVTISDEQLTAYRAIVEAADDEIASGVVLGDRWTEFATGPGNPASMLQLLASFEAARARVAELTAELDESRGYAGRAHGQALALLARVTELQAQVAARDARITELEDERDEALGRLDITRARIQAAEYGAHAARETRNRVASKLYRLRTRVAELEGQRERHAIALGAAWDDGNATGLDGWVGPGRGEEVDDEAVRARERAIEAGLGGPARSNPRAVPDA